MKKVTRKDFEKVKSVLNTNPYFNVYILGDMERYGFDKEYLECYINDDVDHIQYVLMRFKDSFVLYANNDNFDLMELKSYFERRKIHCISGETKTINRLKSIFSNSEIIENKMLKLDKFGVLENDGYDIRKLSTYQINEIQKFYLQIDEFQSKFANQSGIERISEQFRNGSMYALYVEGEIASMMALSAETQSQAMIDNVATSKAFRRRGLSYNLLKQVCEYELVKCKKDFLCVYCSDIRAEMLYRKLGFEDVGNYSMLYR